MGDVERQKIDNAELPKGMNKSFADQLHRHYKEKRVKMTGLFKAALEDIYRNEGGNPNET